MRAVWQQREAIHALVQRQFRARFAQPLVGLIWMLLQPLALAGLFSLFFGALVRVPSGDLPYPAFVFVGIALWQGVSRALAEAATSFESAGPLLRQTSMPRMAPVLAQIASASMDVLAALLIAFAVGLFFGLKPGLGLFALPVFLGLAMMATIGFSAALAGICGAWRDVRQLVPLGLQFFMFASPVIYPLSLIPSAWQTLYLANPYAGILNGLRWSLLGGPAPEFSTIIISASASFLIFVIGIWVFLKTEGKAANAL